MIVNGRRRGWRAFVEGGGAKALVLGENMNSTLVVMGTLSNLMLMSGMNYAPFIRPSIRHRVNIT